MTHRIIEGDCFDLIKKLPDNSIDLVVTSPPYSDIINYGKNVSIKKPDEYVDWLLPLLDEIYRVLKPSGSFILNINDKCENGYKSTFIFDLISRNASENNLKMYDYYIWHKKAGIPTGGKNRFRNTTEWIFHFCKDKSQMKCYMDRVLVDAKQTSLSRYNYDLNGQGVVENGVRKRKRVRASGLQSEKVRPDNVFRFNTASASRDNLIKHPAPFHKELPSYFINLLTDENDIILDPFSGIGTTSLAAKELNRKSIGFELNKSYIDFSIKRLNGDLSQEYVINQYDLEDNFIQSFSSPSEVLKNVPSVYSIDDLKRAYMKGVYKTCGGYKWKLSLK